MRDDFTASIKRILATRTGHLCSNPGCRHPTAGPGLEANATVSIGVAAHITAASPGTKENPGPRYDESLTPQQRSDISNGIWLCQNCAKLVDSDIQRYAADLLRKWKVEAEARAFEAIATSKSAASNHIIVVAELDDADREFLRSLSLAADEDIEVVTERLLQAAQNDIAAFRGARQWPGNVIELNLVLHVGAKQDAVALEGIATAIGIVDGLSMISAAGTGKTTTLIQLAEKIVAAGHAVPAIVPLGEWSGSGEDFFQFLTRRNAFRRFRQQHFQQLAFYGRLVFLIDGWNEADADSRLQGIRQLGALRRDFPLLGVVIGTRRQPIPFTGPVIEIEQLSENQQLDMARRFPGGSREAILDQAWRTPGIRELIATPLYLNALLSSTKDGSFPRTKEEVLRAFVAQHENAPDKAEILKKELFGFHKDMLIGLAVAANSSASATISDEKARSALSKVGARLAADGQISACPQPSVALDVLVDTHALVRAAEGGSVSFQHQQFQEWYASFEVERLMLKAAQNDSASKKIIRTEVLNWLAWEESILFACERLSRKDASGEQAVAATVLETLTIDPMLAAEMIYRSDENVWKQIKEKVVGFANRWHQPDVVDRAVGFMIATGRADFFDHIWPLISNPDSQVYLLTLRKPGRFRPSVLGPDATKRLAGLKDEVRGNVVAAMASESGFDGLELATEVAKSDPNPSVVVEIIGTLEFRGADRHVSEILETASNEVWEEFAARGARVRLKEPTHRARLAKLMAEEDTTDPVHKLSLLVNRPSQEDVGYAIEQLIASEQYPAKAELAAAAIRRACERYPHRVKAALLQRLQAGLPVPHETEELLKDAPVVDEGPFAAAALDKATPKRLARFASSVVGPETVGRIMDQLLALRDELEAEHEKFSEASRTEYWRLIDGIVRSRQSSFLGALLKRAYSDKPHRIQMMAELLARHGRGNDERQLVVRDDVRDSLVKCFKHWFGVMLTSPDANRHQFASVVDAATRLPQPQFVGSLHKMLERDLNDWARAREEWKKPRQGGPIPPDVTHSYTNQYRRAFAIVGGAEVIALMKGYLPNLTFGLDAAWVLNAVWSKENPSGKELRFGVWHDFSDVTENRRRRQDTKNPLATSDFAEAVFSVVKTLGTPTSDAASQRHAIQLATIGLRLPHGAKRSEIDALMALPLPCAAKQGLVTAAAKAGEVIPVRDLIAGVQELLEVAKMETWRLDKNHGELMGWIELFPFSDEPGRVIEVLNTLPQQNRYPHDLDRLLIAVADSPHDDALAVLKALAEWNAGMLDNYHWISAVFKLESEAALRLLVDFICDSKLRREMHFSERQLADWTKRHPTIQAEILRRYTAMPQGKPRSSLKSILRELSDPEIVLAFIRSYAAHHEPYDGSLAHVVRETAVGRRPVPNWPNAYQEFSVSLAALRKELFAMMLANNAESDVAEACLNQIEELRDEHGRVSDEPRHPDIDSGKPWPKEAVF